MIEKRPQLTHSQVDATLDKLADDPEGFEAATLVWIEELDAVDGKHPDLEIVDPVTWRSPASSDGPRSSFENQFRHDVDRIQILDRRDEARLARRIEFARLRYGAVAERMGLQPSSCFDEVGQNAAAYFDPTGAKEAASPELMRRAAELHALRSEMVERNLYLVLINVERYTHSGASRVDLIQEGSTALYRAVDGFDWRRGLLFRTYAVHWLNQAFRNYLYNFNNTVRVPVYLQKALKHINQAQIKIGDLSATPEEIAKTADLDTKLVTTAMAAARTAYSLDSGAADEESGNRLRDILTEDEDADPYTTRLEDVSLEAGLRVALERLSDRERFVVTRRFGLGMEREHTLAEVAAELGVSVERVRQIQVRAVSKLDTPGLRRELDPFLN